MIICIGNYCQGIIEVPPSTSDNNAGSRDQSRAANGFVRVERWRFQPTKNSSLSASGIGEIVEEEAKKGRRAEKGEDAEHGKWIRDGRSDYTENPGEGMWMPCLWVCEKERRLGDSMEREGFVGMWRVIEAEG